MPTFLDKSLSVIDCVNEALAALDVDDFHKIQKVACLIKRKAKSRGDSELGDNATRLEMAARSSDRSRIAAIIQRVYKIIKHHSVNSDRFATKRFLIVDDDPITNEFLAAFLSPLGQCDFAEDGREAVTAVRLAIADNKPYDAICLDIMMPKMDGHLALAAVREVEARYGITGTDGAKIIMVTALRDPEHCIQSFREGCESYVTKPVEQAAIIGKLKELGVFCNDSAVQGAG